MSREENVIRFYVLCNKLKNVIRTGWKDWHVNRERLESVELPDSITKIGRWSFLDCVKLKEINIPKNVKDVSISIIHSSGVQRVYLHADSLTNNPKLKELSDYVDFIIKDKC